jgi:hypothetical protein
MIYKNKNKKMEEKKMDKKKDEMENLNWLYEKKEKLTDKQFIYLLKEFHGIKPNKWEDA